MILILILIRYNNNNLNCIYLNNLQIKQRSYKLYFEMRSLMNCQFVSRN